MSNECDSNKSTGEVSFFEKLLEMFTGKNNEDRAKEKRLKAIGKEISQYSSKFFNVRKLTFLTNFGSVCYPIFRGTQHIAKFFNVKERKVSIREYLIDSHLNVQMKNLKEQLSPESIADSIKTSTNPTKAITDIQKKLKEFITFFDSKKIAEIESIYSQIINMSGLINFGWYFFLRKFDSAITESNFSYKPSFEALEGKYLIDDLVEINDDLNSVDLYGSFVGVIKYLQEVSGDQKIGDGFNKVLINLKKLKNNNVLTKIICLIMRDPYFKAKSFATKEKLVSDYLINIQESVKRAIEETVVLLNKEKSNQLLMEIFGTTVVVRMKYFTPKLASFISHKGVSTVMNTIDPINYIRAFLLDFCANDVKSRIDLLIIKGQWHTASLSSRYTMLIDNCTRLLNDLLRLDQNCSEEGAFGKEIKRHSISSSSKGSLNKVVEDLNTKSISLIIEAISVFTGMAGGIKELLEDYNKKVPVMILNVKRIKWEFDQEFMPDMIAIYKKLGLMVTMLKRYTKAQ